MRKDEVERRKRPAIIALMLGSWSELPLSVELSQMNILEFGFVGRQSCLRTTTLAFEAASEIVSEES